jgi:pimeloyl-ACP methyl ester carboxylesterase/DNA-binding winged helix-turn-helix (wHTH) protein
MRYRFGQCELVPETRELLVAGVAQPVGPQVFDLLLFLVRGRARVISTDDLIAAIWDGRVVSDSAIAARISAARAVIGDDGERQAWIKTIRGRGFRFVGSVDEVLSQPATVPDRVAESGQLARQRIAFCRARDGTRIAYAVSGSGYPVLKAGHWLTHLEHDARSPVWRPFYDRLNQGFSLVRYDQRGNGLSDWDVADFSFDRFVEDIEAVVEASGLQRFALLGMSQGAPIAIAYAARHPERVSHLVLYGGYEKGRLLRGSASEREQGEAILTLIRHGWGKPGSPFINAFTSMFIPDGTKEQVDSLVDLQRLTTSPENAALLRAAVDRFDASAEVGRVAVPTLVLHSRDDGVQPLEQGRQLAANIPGAEFVMLESRDHIILSQEPAWAVLFGEIERFIGGGANR